MLARTKVPAASLAATFFVAVLSAPTVASDDRQFSIYLDTDAPGYDYSQFDPPSEDYCKSRCAAEQRCKAFTYNRVKRVCFLKGSARFPLIPHAEATTGRKIVGGRFSIKEDRDAPGHDYQRLDPPSLSECQSACRADEQCKAFTYNVEKTVCFLKYKADIASLVGNNEAITGIRAAGTAQSPPVGESGTREIPLMEEAGTFKVPVLINGVIPLDFTLDSGASYVSIPADVVRTLIRTGTLKDGDFLGTKTFVLADGSMVPSETFRIRRLEVGDSIVENVVASVGDVKGTPLLGQSFLSRFKSWSIDNDRQALILR